MEEVVVTGWLPYSLTDECTGQLIEGVSFHLRTFAPPDNQPRFVGCQCIKKSMLKNVYEEYLAQGGYLPEPGTKCFVIYSSSGKVRGFQPISEKK